MRFSDLSALDFALALMQTKRRKADQFVVVVNLTPMAIFDTKNEAELFVAALSERCIAKFEIKKRK